MLDYEAISDLSAGIVQCDNALEKLKSLAKKLAKSGADLDVEITITEGQAPVKKPEVSHRQNAGQPIAIIVAGQDIFSHQDLANQIHTQNREADSHYKKDGLSQKGMPNALALVMLESMQKYYKRQRQALEFAMIEALAKLDINQLKDSQELIE